MEDCGRIADLYHSLKYNPGGFQMTDCLPRGVCSGGLYQHWRDKQARHKRGGFMRTPPLIF